MDIFIILLAVIAAVLVVTGICILNNRKLEIGALLGLYPLVWGVGIGALAALLAAIQHLRFHLV